ncbi:DUF3137 domain-containing protein [uncultured Draconibacterium sp.]|uniref:DUF3137 domain-containing protein n=1 Tax=uncultured Draconibacterium sp. TaxID=1573823 RepID=UPI0032171088
MNTKERLQILYDTELKPQLAEMEKMRRFVKRWRAFAITSLILAFLFLYSDYVVLRILGGAGFFAGAIYAAVLALRTYNKYHKQFKTEVVRKVVHLINPDYKYNSAKHIEVYEYNKAALFKCKAERCIGDDLVFGKIDKTPFKFSEVKTQYKTTTTNDEGKKVTEWHTIFRGLFFFAEFNKNLEGQTFVFPEKDRTVTNFLGKEKEESRIHGELVKLENPEFEKIFSVYSTSQQEARYVLTPLMMEAIVTIYNTFGFKMYFSFRGENVFCAIPFNRNLFEPSIKRSGVNFRDVEEMYMLFGLIKTLVQEMNLNTRIWTKSWN